MSDLFICPICREILHSDPNRAFCASGHSFDRSRYGYVNLLLSNTSGVHGDNKLMIRARRDFLDSGAYDALRKSLVGTLGKYVERGVILDAGCGEGYYLSGFDPEKYELFGIDISKDALIYAGKRSRSLSTAVASVYDMPVADESADAVLSVFSPFSANEFSRVLKGGGYLVSVIPDADHLIELKRAIYDEVFVKDEQNPQVEGFSLIETVPVSEKVRLASNKQIMDLFSMTPYFYRTSDHDKEKLANLNELTVSAKFKIYVYQK